MRTFKRTLAWLPALLPLAYLALFYGYVLRARLVLGVWPRPYQPDPKDLGFALHRLAVLLTLPVWAISPVLLLGWLLFWPRRQRKALLWPFLAFLLIWLLGWLLLRLDPGQFGAWFMD